MHASTSCPSPNTSASMTTVSPMMRFAGKRPQSTSGRTRSMTARTRPSARVRRGLRALALGVRGSLAFMLEINHRERRQRDAYRVKPAVNRHRMRIDTTVIAHSAAAVNRCVRVQQLFPEARFGDTQEIVFARHGCEVADDEHGTAAGPRVTNERERAFIGI